jgi:hypothetical protein
MFDGRFQQFNVFDSNQKLTSKQHSKCSQQIITMAHRVQLARSVSVHSFISDLSRVTHQLFRFDLINEMTSLNAKPYLTISQTSHNIELLH